MKYFVLLFICLGSLKSPAQSKNLNLHLQDIETIYCLPTIQLIEKFLSEKGLDLSDIIGHKNLYDNVFESKPALNKTRINITMLQHSNKITNFEIHSEDTAFIQSLYKDCETLGYKKLQQVNYVYYKYCEWGKITFFNDLEMEFKFGGGSDKYDSFITYFFYIAKCN